MATRKSLKKLSFLSVACAEVHIANHPFAYVARDNGETRLLLSDSLSIVLSSFRWPGFDGEE